MSELDVDMLLDMAMDCAMDAGHPNEPTPLAVSEHTPRVRGKRRAAAQQPAHEARRVVRPKREMSCERRRTDAPRSDESLSFTTTEDTSSSSDGGGSSSGNRRSRQWSSDSGSDEGSFSDAGTDGFFRNSRESHGNTKSSGGSCSGSSNCAGAASSSFGAAAVTSRSWWRRTVAAAPLATAPDACVDFAPLSRCDTAAGARSFSCDVRSAVPCRERVVRYAVSTRCCGRAHTVDRAFADFIALARALGLEFTPELLLDPIAVTCWLHGVLGRPGVSAVPALRCFLETTFLDGSCAGSADF